MPLAMTPDDTSKQAATPTTSAQRLCFSPRTKRFWVILGLLVLAIGLGVGLGVGLTRGSSDNGDDDTPSPPKSPTNNTGPAAGTYWKPAAGTTWQIVLQQALGTTAPNVSVYDIDLFDNNATIINTLHGMNRKVICYFSAGSYEDFRPDSDQFKKSDYGKELKGWPGEFWLDIRSENVRSIMKARLKVAASMGCDGVDPDNVDGFANDSGFPLNTTNTLDFLTFLAEEAHGLGMAIGLKNAGDLVGATVDFLQWEVNEQCVQYEECKSFRPFVDAGKPVFNIEYVDGKGVSTKQKVCGDNSRSGFSTLLKNMDLSDWVEAC
ncbi:uncharacterized protein BP5553_03074 [Venustampulla echinocandica]|uniref:alpha-galactosidase n=1 Tax=Venustampulla echinocandica TaxID=2656787 RepID=A0A370TTB7_9HELO|nr:uncharacterized protein BP5553_03074 [Venustampulla echinocandica]RDL38734.1 hypothetical protein BP5553_03074 [Venustampulla echinocandica]